MPGINDRDPIPGTPGYVAEAAQRHREQPTAEQPEVRPNQRVSEPLREFDVGTAQGSSRTKITDETRHDAK